MAAQTCIRAQTATLTATTADGITFSDGAHNRLRVTNHHATEKLYVRLDATTPVAEADENYICLATQSLELPFRAAACGVVGNGNIYTVAVFSI